MAYSPKALERRKKYQRDFARAKRRTPSGRIASKKAWQEFAKKSSPEERREWGRKGQIRYRLKLFGLTEEIYDKLSEAGCVICGGENTWRGFKARLCIDHDHSTGKFRGLLCHNCNSALGYFKDDVARLLAAVRYLQRA